MILTCPQCETRYQTDAARFPADGRKVRCAKCGQTWHQAAPGFEADPTPAQAVASPVATPAPAASASAADGIFSTPSPRPPPARLPLQSWAERLGLLAGWAGFGALIFLIGWTALRFRQDIVTLWPQSSSLYAMLGVAVVPHGIEFANVAYHRETEGGQTVLAVTGRLVNISTRELTVPQVQVTLTDAGRHELYRWSFHASQPTLRPGQSLNFLTRLSSPPPAARHLQLRFAAARE